MALELVRLTPEQKRRRRRRSVAIGLLLAAVVALFYVLAVYRMSNGALPAPA